MDRAIQGHHVTQTIQAIDTELVKNIFPNWDGIAAALVGYSSLAASALSVMLAFRSMGMMRASLTEQRMLRRSHMH